MLEILPSPRPHVIAIRVEGKVSDEEFETLARRIEQLADQHKSLDVFAEIVSFKGMPPTTFLKDLWFALQHRNDFGRVAIVSDVGWIKQMATLQGKMVPSMDVRTFKLAEAESARAWLTMP